MVGDTYKVQQYCTYNESSGYSGQVRELIGNSFGAAETDAWEVLAICNLLYVPAVPSCSINYRRPRPKRRSPAIASKIAAAP